MTSSSRPSRSPSRAPRAPESILPDGEVGEGAAELLHEFVHPHGHPAHPLEETLVDDGVQAFGDDDEANEIALGFEQAECASRPWWRRPSAWWFLGSVPFSMTAFAATIAPRFEVLTVIVCYASDMRNQPEGAPAVTDRPIPCAKDPHIEAQVTAVITSMALITGILSCFMTGFWGSLSDRRGRVFILRLNVVSLVVADTFFILVYWFPKAILGGYWALLIPSIIDGFLGGRMAASAAMHAYMTDCSAPATRSRIFSQFLGFMFIGLAVGPTMGSLITRYSHQAISAFYFAGTVHLGYAILVWFIIPESLMPTQMRSFRHRHAASMDEMRTNGGRLLPLKRLFSFLSPLAILMPLRIEGGGGGSPQKWKTRRDWSLTLLALAYFPDTMILGAYGVTFQFAAATYDWSSEMLGYWLSIVGASRALFLAVILPAILHFFRPKPSRIELPPSPSESHGTDAATTSRTHSPTQSPGSGVKSKHVPKLDLTVSRLSLIALICSYIIMASSPPGWGFVSASVLGSLSAGFVPTVQSLAIEIYRHQGGHETGKLFGALSTLSSLGSSIIGPFLYGIIYIRTVATVPTAIFFVSAGALLVSFFFLLFVRLPAGLGDDVRAHDREETLVGGEGPGETRREEEVSLTRDMDG